MSRFGGRLRGVQPVSGWLRGGSVGIKSIQRGTITIGNTATSNTATLATSVDPANSRIRYLGCGTNDNTSPEARVTLTNATTVTATRIGTSNNTTVSYEVTEYQPGVIKSVQRGVISMASGNSSGTATITAVDTTKAECECLGDTTTDAGAPTNPANNGYVALTNATTVTATHGNTYDWSVGWQVVEFY